MVTRERQYSADEFWDFINAPNNHDRHFELHEGVVTEMSPSGFRHGDVAAACVMWVRLFVMQHKLGVVTTAEAGYILYKNPDPNGKDIVYSPDVGFVVAARVPSPRPIRFFPFAPDLAFEVISPSETDEEIENKVRNYLRYGTRMVCNVFSETRTVQVHTPSGSVTLGENDTLDGGDVLPGFTLPVRDIFADPLAE